jgi:hypothetical protein
MHKYFLVKVKFEKTAEDDKIVKVSELYLVDALSFTECEARITKEMQPFISGEFEVAEIRKKNYSEIVKAYYGINAIEAEANKMLKSNIPNSTEADKWFECKLNFITLDEEKGVEKKTPVFMLVHANTVNSAHDSLIEHMHGSMADYTIEGVKETKIIDVYEYEPNN